MSNSKNSIDNHGAYESFLKFQESVRWSYHFAKENNFEPEKNNFSTTPWYSRTTKAAPKASAAVETFLEACLRDLMDPKLRRKIHDNLSVDERNALKDIVKNFPVLNLRIRMEDKGGRFCVVDGEAIIRIRKLGTDDIKEYHVSGNEIKIIDMPIWYTHNIENTGENKLTTIFWISELYDESNPDTFYEKV